MNVLRAFVLALVLLAGFSAKADIPRLISFQGHLADPGGAPVTGSVQILFSLYAASSGGSALWSEDRTVNVANGLYNVALGSVTPLNLAFDVPYYLGIKVGSDAEMTPRPQLASAPYALRAGCYAGDFVSCYSGAASTIGVGSCKAGARTCNASGSGWSACVGEVTPTCGNYCCAAGQACSGGICTGNVCASGPATQTFTNGMVGCMGAATFANRASLCGPNYTPCTAAQWVANRGGAAPAYNYWTADPLYYGGAGTGNCLARPTPGASCAPGQSMLVCAATVDPVSNTCTWINCGYETTTPNQYFGGCSGNTASTLCCPA